MLVLQLLACLALLVFTFLGVPYIGGMIIGTFGNHIQRKFGDNYCLDKSFDRTHFLCSLLAYLGCLVVKWGSVDNGIALIVVAIIIYLVWCIRHKTVQRTNMQYGIGLPLIFLIIQSIVFYIVTILVKLMFSI